MQGAPVSGPGGQGQGDGEEDWNPGGEEEDCHLEEHPTTTRVCHRELQRPAQMDPLRRRRSFLAIATPLVAGLSVAAAAMGSRYMI
ncbi:hypothetical protein ZWY2020_033788 [Hordeum vulgare]|nr:hypothetical protein ZWY2020_033788 [Hordeum vulgare]